MNFKDVLKIYPNSYISESPHDEDTHLSLYRNGEFLIVDKTNMNENEILLLMSHFEQASSISELHKYLIHDDHTINLAHDYIECIYFYTKDVGDVQSEWLLSIQSLFEGVVDAFFIDDHYGVVILDKHYILNDELEGIINMMDDDYITSTHIYIGLYSNAHNFKNIFNEEFELFKTYKNLKKILSFNDVYLQYYTQDVKNKSDISKLVKDILHTDLDLVKLINSLWDHQGNISKTSKDLYLHRNTVSYRIDKLIDDLGIDLKDPKQLLLCYILIN